MQASRMGEQQVVVLFVIIRVGWWLLSSMSLAAWEFWRLRQLLYSPVCKFVFLDTCRVLMPRLIRGLFINWFLLLLPLSDGCVMWCNT